MTKARALLVLDDPQAATALSIELSGQGYRVDVVDSGLAAIRKVWEEQYQKVLVDGGLRGMRARQLCNHLNDLDPSAEIRVLDRAERAA